MKLYFENHPLLEGIMRYEDGKVNQDGSSDFLGEYFRLSREVESVLEKPDERREMAKFKMEFYAEVAAIPKSSSIKYMLNISEAAFEKMKNDPEYREQIMGLLKRDLTGNYMGRTTIMFTVGEEIEHYRADSWSDFKVSEWTKDDKNGILGKSSIFTRKNRDDYFEQLLEEQYLLKRRMRLKQIEEEAFEAKDKYSEYLKTIGSQYRLENFTK